MGVMVNAVNNAGHAGGYSAIVVDQIMSTGA